MSTLEPLLLHANTNTSQLDCAMTEITKHFKYKYTYTLCSNLKEASLYCEVTLTKTNPKFPEYTESWYQTRICKIHKIEYVCVVYPGLRSHLFSKTHVPKSGFHACQAE